jgi:hypothetical protein
MLKQTNEQTNKQAQRYTHKHMNTKTCAHTKAGERWKITLSQDVAKESAQDSASPERFYVKGTCVGGLSLFKFDAVLFPLFQRTIVCSALGSNRLLFLDCLIFVMKVLASFEMLGNTH